MKFSLVYTLHHAKNNIQNKYGKYVERVRNGDFLFHLYPFKNDWKLCILMFLHIPYVPVCVLLLQCESVKLLKAVV